jgi:hypothetical protein
MTDLKKQLLNELQTLEIDCVLLGGCTVTDRPDLPLSDETSWTPDLTRQLELIEHLTKHFSSCTSPLGAELETFLLKAQQEAQAKQSAELGNTSMALGGAL